MNCRFRRCSPSPMATAARRCWHSSGSTRPPARSTRPASVAPSLGYTGPDCPRSVAPIAGRPASRALPNDPCDTWVEFFVTGAWCRSVGSPPTPRALPTAALAKLDSVIDRLAEFAGPPEPPARLHGDLWAGNRIVDRAGRSWLIDPAAHGGHREFDLAMMRLFGGYGVEAFEAYDTEYPLADGWQRRVPLHQLAPLTVHAIKFGGGYAGATERALDAVLAR